jgi:hypothetical protein
MEPRDSALHSMVPWRVNSSTGTRFTGTQPSNTSGTIWTPFPRIQVPGKLPGALNTTSELFTVGHGTYVCELLRAVPFVRVDPAFVTALTASAPEPIVETRWRSLAAAPTQAEFYDSATLPAVLTTLLGNNAKTLSLRRLGLAFAGMQVDQPNSVAGTTQTDQSQSDVSVNHRLKGAMARLHSLRGRFCGADGHNLLESAIGRVGRVGGITWSDHA